MSMPEFPSVDCDLTIEKALSMILSSIAMEELALSHVINAESEKLTCLLDDCCNIDPCLLLNINKSVTTLLDKVLENQLLLKNKMERALDALAYHYPCCDLPCCPADPPPCAPSCRPHCLCEAVFKNCNYNWTRNHTLTLIPEKSSCFRLNNNSHIILPAGNYEICFKMQLQCKPAGDIAIKLNTANQSYTNSCLLCFPGRCDSLEFFSKKAISIPCSEENAHLKFILITPGNINIKEVTIQVRSIGN